MHVSIPHLLTAIQAEPAFKLPVMEDGVAYLYHRVYVPLSQDKDVSLKSLDFEAFDQDDLETLKEMYDMVFEANSFKANGLTSTLTKIAPVSKSVLYV